MLIIIIIWILEGISIIVTQIFFDILKAYFSLILFNYDSFGEKNCL